MSSYGFGLYNLQCISCNREKPSLKRVARFTCQDCYAINQEQAWDKLQAINNGNVRI